MLVLSRKKNETLVFPSLGISVEILRVDGKAVRIGVQAPRNVRVLRGELLDNDSKQEHAAAAPHQPAEPERNARHTMRNQLNTATMAIHLLQKQLDAGRTEDAEKTLTLAVDALAKLEHSAAQPEQRPAAPQPAASLRALVVEDNANERQLLAGFLEMCGYHVDVVEDGVSAMEYLAMHERPDVVLLDMHMPRMDGPSTVSAIRRHPAYENIAVFAVSGEDEKNVKIEASDRGIDRWFSKPLKPTEFAKTLAEELKRASCLN